jgi:hypothetical protein
MAVGEHILRRAAANHRRLAGGEYPQKLAPRGFSPTAVFTSWASSTVEPGNKHGKSLLAIYMLKSRPLRLAWLYAM